VAGLGWDAAVVSDGAFFCGVDAVVVDVAHHRSSHRDRPNRRKEKAGAPLES